MVRLMIQGGCAAPTSTGFSYTFFSKFSIAVSIWLCLDIIINIVGLVNRYRNPWFVIYTLEHLKWHG